MPSGADAGLSSARCHPTPFGRPPIGDTAPANFVPMNMADDWLHLVLAVGMIGLGVLLGRDRRALP